MSTGDQRKRHQPRHGETSRHGEKTVTDPPMDRDDHPPDDPPPGVAQPTLWRLAVRLYRDHGGVVRDARGLLACSLCHQPWPCRGRRLAQLGLAEAWLPPRGRGRPSMRRDR